MTQLSLVKAASQGQEIAAGADLPGAEVFGNQDGELCTAFKLPRDALRGYGPAGRPEASFKKVFPPGNLGQVCHILYIIRIMKQEKVEAEAVPACQIMIVYRNQFAACHGVGAGINPQHLLYGFLLDIIQTAQILVGLYHLHQVDAFLKGEGPWDVQEISPCFGKWKVKPLAVEMNQGIVIQGIFQKSPDDIGFFHFSLGEPLDQLPLPVPEAGCADQVDHIGFPGKTCGLYIKKKDPAPWGTDPFIKMSGRKRFFYGKHNFFPYSMIQVPQARLELNDFVIRRYPCFAESRRLADPKKHGIRKAEQCQGASQNIF